MRAILIRHAQSTGPDPSAAHHRIPIEGTNMNDAQNHHQKPVSATLDVRQLAAQDTSQLEAWCRALGQKMVEASKRMQTDLQYRRHIQARTR